MVEFMLRALIVGGLATVAAYAFENALMHARLPARCAWTLALLLSITLPMIPPVSEQPATQGIPTVVVPSVVVSAAADMEAGLPFNVLLAVWLMLAALALGIYVFAYLRLRKLQTHWTRSRIGDVEVFVSDGFGPAVFGFVRPRIVVPEWVRGVAREEQQLIVLHEREHVRAGDQWQLLVSIVATVVMPWNPFLWLQKRRLAFRVETDCDARVVTIVPDAQRYARLLLNVGAKQSGLLLMPALAEERNGLERRLRMLATGIVRNRWKAAALLGLGAVVMVMACESRLPNEPQQPAPRNRVMVPSFERKQQRTPEQERDIGKLMQKHYPPLLRQAGIGGTVGVEATIHTDGTVDYRIVKSSGHDALDQAALRVVNEMRLLPRRVRAGQQPKDEVRGIILQFDPSPASTRRPDTAVVLPPMKDVTDAPVFTPFTERPELENRDEIQLALAREYPPLLRDAGVSGTVFVWLLLDEQGDVIKAQLKQGTGHEALDSAGIRVARKMRFTPARNREQVVKVWIQIPIVFRSE